MDLSAGALFASMGVGSVGFGLFLYGKKQLRTPQLATGLLMIAYPYFVPSAALMLGIAGVLLLGLWTLVRAGY